jgi:hypothetical protein
MEERMKVECTVFSTYIKEIIILEGEILLDNGKQVINLGSYQEGSCWKGDPKLVLSIMEELDKQEIEYKFPPLFLHKGKFNYFNKTLYVSEVEPWDDGEWDEFINDDGDYEWVDPFLTFTKD